MRVISLIATLLTLNSFLSLSHASLIAEPIKVTDVYVVIKSHFDLGFTDMAENVFHQYRTEMMDHALLNFEMTEQLPKDQRFVWTVPGWPLLQQMLGPKQSSTRRTQIENAVREGLLTTHALAFTTYTESLDLEDLVRSLGYSSSVARRFNLPLPISAKMTDVPSHSWVLPTLLAHAGVKFLHLGVNSASQYPRVPQLFWWQGADGSRVLTAYNINYGSGLLPPTDWPSKNYLSMIMTNDNHGPPSPKEVAEFRRTYAEKMPGVKVHFGTLDDFAKAILEEELDLPVISGDMPDTWIHGVMADAQATKSARGIRPLETTLGVLDTQLNAWGVETPPVAQTLADAHEQSLLYGEHTWGMNAEFGPRREFGKSWKKWLRQMEREPIPADGDYTKLPNGNKRKWMKSYEDHRNYANSCEKITRGGLNERMKLLSSNVKGNPGDVVVFNPLPWMRSGLVQANGISFFAADVPASGYRVYPSSTASIAPAEMSGHPTLETPFYIITFDLQQGGISSLIEKATQRELVDKSSPYLIGQFLHERFSSNEVFDRFFHQYSRMQTGWGLEDFGKPGMPNARKVPYRAITLSDWNLSVSQTEDFDIATIKTTQTQGLAKAYSISFTIPRKLPYIDVSWSVDTKVAEKHPEGGWLTFPFAIEKPTFTVGRLGAPINPATNIIPGTNRHLMAVTTGVSINNDSGKSVSLCPIDSPLISLGKPGLWWWTMDYIPQTPTVFVNLYNNMWNTNFPLWQGGSWSNRVRIWTNQDGTPIISDLTKKSWEARVPLMSATVDQSNQALPSEKTGISVSRAGVLVTAFAPNPDGEGTVLRIWEQSGINDEVSIFIPGNFNSATPVNLRGEKLSEPLQIKSGKLSVYLKAYAPSSFILE